MDIPADYMDLLGGGLPEGARWGEDEPLDFIHVFVERPNELSDTFKYLKAILKQTGMLWMSWRKMQSDKMMDMKS